MTVSEATHPTPAATGFEPEADARRGARCDRARLARVAAAALSAPAAAVWIHGEGWATLHGLDAPTEAALHVASMAFTGGGARAFAMERDGSAAFGDAFDWCAATQVAGPGGTAVGALCVFDRGPRTLRPREAAALEDVGRLHESVCDPAPARGGDREAGRLRALFDAILENTDALVFIKRRNGELLAANRMYRLTALRDDIEGATDAEIYGPATAAALRANDSAVFETGEPFHGEERVALPCGGEAVYLSSKFLVRDPVDGEPVLCAIATDITEQKALQARLEASRREAEAANVAKSEFLAAMSHEIRTPMNGVLGMLALLANTELSEKQKRMATVARDSAASLLGLLNDILDYARIATRQSPAARQHFNLRAAISAASAPHRETMRRKGLDFVETVDSALPGLVVGDAGRFRQVLGALVSNAAKFTAGGTVTVAASLVDGPAEPMVRVSVRDTGVGVAEGVRERIFLGFAQGDGSHTRRFGGVGLGLSIAKLMVESMGGAMDFQSVEGEGATFWFTIPVAGPPGPGAVRDA
ncbi:Signal transduction histidine kinase [Rubrimonas cliftonensis]|uniref:histidine kinase n=1 Tax=Rubrimonas cliftonensis TaxID=89524 RepID=A0A1H4D724_9RHOB|nr:Signal transduction histidine kinase [Rubrimonas cliftonensis]